ncbi:hypothetical protein TWF694_005117 [Orbilia ellipsospora]|uniref:Ankyrin n=1 Tax=Orbilia ellipsospora TaxID=2528407 RepID=A0AAV9WW78_9PEZI
MATPRPPPPVPVRPSPRSSTAPTPTDTVGKPNVASPIENTQPGSITSHEQAEHSSNASLRLETAVRFTGVLIETEDLVAAAQYWKERQEHVEGRDFYAFLARRETETLAMSEGEAEIGIVAVAGGTSKNQETTVKGTGTENAIATGVSKTRTETSVIKKKKPPPPPPPRSRNVRGTSNNPAELSEVLSSASLQTAPVDLAAFSEPQVGNQGPSKPDKIPVLPPKLPIVSQIEALELDSANDNPKKKSPTSNSKTRSEQLSPNNQPSRSSKPTLAAKPQQHRTTPSSIPPSSNPFTIQRELDQARSTNATGSGQYQPSYAEFLKNYQNPASGIQYPGNIQQNTVESASINQFYQNMNHVYGNTGPPLGFQSAPTGLPQNPYLAPFPNPTSSQNLNNTAPPLLTNTFTSPVEYIKPECLILRGTMQQMKSHGIGSPAANNVGMEYIMRLWASISTTKATLPTNSLNEVLDNLKKPSGLGLAETSEGYSFLHVCVRLSKLDMIKELLENGGARITNINPKTTPLLRNAIWYSDEASGVVEYLISKGELINRQSRHGLAAIHYAVAAYNVTAVTALIKAGADINIGLKGVNKEISSINRVAVGKEPKKVEKVLGILFLLLDAGGQVDPEPRNGVPATLFTGVSGFPEVIDVLRSKGTPKWYLDRLESFPLSIAILNKNVSFVKDWIKKGKEVNEFDIFGRLPLEHAIKMKRDDIIILLQDAGARTRVGRHVVTEPGKPRSWSAWYDLGEHSDDSDNWSVAVNTDDNSSVFADPPDDFVRPSTRTSDAAPKAGSSRRRPRNK